MPDSKSLQIAFEDLTDTGNGMTSLFGQTSRTLTFFENKMDAGNMDSYTANL